MRSEPTILAFDTAVAHCAAALLFEGHIRGGTTLPMARGQAEALMPLLERTLAEGPIDWKGLDALAVGIGPGNFTGIRISVSAARGLALALGLPAVGVSLFEVLAARFPEQRELIVCLPAPRDMAYCQQFRDGAPAGTARLIDPTSAEELGPASRAHIVGHRAGEIGKALGLAFSEAEATDIAGSIARIAADRLRQGFESERPAPLYIRPADAAPPADPPPVILP